MTGALRPKVKCCRVPGCKLYTNNEIYSRTGVRCTSGARTSTTIHTEIISLLVLDYGNEETRASRTLFVTTRYDYELRRAAELAPVRGCRDADVGRLGRTRHG